MRGREEQNFTWAFCLCQVHIKATNPPTYHEPKTPHQKAHKRKNGQKLEKKKIIKIPCSFHYGPCDE